MTTLCASNKHIWAAPDSDKIRYCTEVKVPEVLHCTNAPKGYGGAYQITARRFTGMPCWRLGGRFQQLKWLFKNSNEWIVTSDRNHLQNSPSSLQSGMITSVGCPDNTLPHQHFNWLLIQTPGNRSVEIVFSLRPHLPSVRYVPAAPNYSKEDSVGCRNNNHHVENKKIKRSIIKNDTIETKLDKKTQRPRTAGSVRDLNNKQHTSNVINQRSTSQHEECVIVYRRGRRRLYSDSKPALIKEHIESSETSLQDTQRQRPNTARVNRSSECHTASDNNLSPNSGKSLLVIQHSVLNVGVPFKNAEHISKCIKQKSIQTPITSSNAGTLFTKQGRQLTESVYLALKDLQVLLLNQQTEVKLQEHHIRLNYQLDELSSRAEALSNQLHRQEYNNRRSIKSGVALLSVPSQETCARLSLEDEEVKRFSNITILCSRSKFNCDLQLQFKEDVINFMLRCHLERAAIRRQASNQHERFEIIGKYVQGTSHILLKKVRNRLQVLKQFWSDETVALTSQSATALQGEVDLSKLALLECNSRRGIVNSRNEYIEQQLQQLEFCSRRDVSFQFLKESIPIVLSEFESIQLVKMNSCLTARATAITASSKLLSLRHSEEQYRLAVLNQSHCNYEILLFFKCESLKRSEVLRERKQCVIQQQTLLTRFDELLQTVTLSCQKMVGDVIGYYVSEIEIREELFRKQISRIWFLEACCLLSDFLIVKMGSLHHETVIEHCLFFETHTRRLHQLITVLEHDRVCLSQQEDLQRTIIHNTQHQSLLELELQQEIYRRHNITINESISRLSLLESQSRFVSENDPTLLGIYCRLLLSVCCFPKHHAISIITEDLDLKSRLLPAIQSSLLYGDSVRCRKSVQLISYVREGLKAKPREFVIAVSNLLKILIKCLHGDIPVTGAVKKTTDIINIMKIAKESLGIAIKNICGTPVIDKRTIVLHDIHMTVLLVSILKSIHRQESTGVKQIKLSNSIELEYDLELSTRVSNHFRNYDRCSSGGERPLQEIVFQVFTEAFLTRKATYCATGAKSISVAARRSFSSATNSHHSVAHGILTQLGLSCMESDDGRPAYLVNSFGDINMDAVVGATINKNLTHCEFSLVINQETGETLAHRHLHGLVSLRKSLLRKALTIADKAGRLPCHYAAEKSDINTLLLFHETVSQNESESVNISCKNVPAVKYAARDTGDHCWHTLVLQEPSDQILKKIPTEVFTCTDYGMNKMGHDILKHVIYHNKFKAAVGLATCWAAARSVTDEERWSQNALHLLASCEQWNELKNQPMISKLVTNMEKSSVASKGMANARDAVGLIPMQTAILSNNLNTAAALSTACNLDALVTIRSHDRSFPFLHHCISDSVKSEQAFEKPLLIFQSPKNIPHDSLDSYKKITSIIFTRMFIYSRDSSCATALHVAVRNSLFNVVKILLTQCDNLHCRTMVGRTCLHEACYVGKAYDSHQDLIKKLISQNDIAQDDDGFTPFEVALRNESYKTCLTIAESTNSASLQVVCNIAQKYVDQPSDTLLTLFKGLLSRTNFKNPSEWGELFTCVTNNENISDVIEQQYAKWQKKN